MKNAGRSSPASLVSSIVARLSLPPENETTAGSLNSATVSRTNLMASQMRRSITGALALMTMSQSCTSLRGTCSAGRSAHLVLTAAPLSSWTISSEDIFAVPVAKAK